MGKVINLQPWSDAPASLTKTSLFDGGMHSLELCNKCLSRSPILPERFHHFLTWYDLPPGLWIELAVNTHGSIVPPSRLSTTSAHHSYQTLDSSDRLHMLQFTVAPGGTQIGCLSGKYLMFRRERFTGHFLARQDTSACKEAIQYLHKGKYSPVETRKTCRPKTNWELC